MDCPRYIANSVVIGSFQQRFPFSPRKLKAEQEDIHNKFFLKENLMNSVHRLTSNGPLNNQAFSAMPHSIRVL